MSETSFSIAGVTGVVDSCRAKVERISSATCHNKLFVRHVCRDQAEQRKVGPVERDQALTTP